MVFMVFMVFMAPWGSKAAGAAGRRSPGRAGHAPQDRGRLSAAAAGRGRRAAAGWGGGGGARLTVGTADISATLYRCSGRAKKLRRGARSTMCPRYITAM